MSVKDLADIINHPGLEVLFNLLGEQINQCEKKIMEPGEGKYIPCLAPIETQILLRESIVELRNSLASSLGTLALDMDERTSTLLTNKIKSLQNKYKAQSEE